jgi:hypothetical protein
MMFRIGQPRGKRNVMASPLAYGSILLMIRGIRQAFLLFTLVGNHVMTTTYATRQAKSLAIYYRLCALS